MIASGVFDVVNGLTEWLGDISARWWFVLVIFIIALLDSVVPIVPSESTVIIGGIAAGQGDQLLLLVIFMGAVGAFFGDSIAYTLGKRFRSIPSFYVFRKPSMKFTDIWQTSYPEGCSTLFFVRTRI